MPWCGPDGAPEGLLVGGAPSEVLAGPGGDEGQGRSYLRLRGLEARLHGLPVWELSRLLSCGPGACPPEASTAPAGEAGAGLTGTLAAGLAVVHPSGALGRPVLELRHAAHEIDALIGRPAASAEEEAAACLPPPLPPPAALPGPLGEHVVWRADRARTCVSLTFDACSTFAWGPYNREVIAALRRLAVPATLFIGGHWAELHEDELRDIAADPLFEVGNHTYSHPHPRELDAPALRQQVLWAQWAIFSRTGVVPSLLRLPYAEIDEPTAARVAALGLKVIQYDLPAGDASSHVGAERLVAWVGGRAQAGSIVVLHMNRPGNHTALALPGILASLRARGLRPCTVSEALAEGDA